MLKKMRYVYTVYEEKSFSKAAERLFVSQPSLSAMVKKVESDYGITIFDRTTTPVSLTPEGEYYIHTAKRVLKLETDMRQHFRECSKGLNGSVTFGGSSFFCANMLSGIIRQFNETLRDHCFCPGNMSNGIHGIYETKPIGAGAFREIPFVFQREGNDSHTRGMRICENAGFAPRVILQVDTSMTGYQLAIAGNGAFFVRDSVLWIEASDKLCYYKLDDPLTLRDIFLYYRLDGRSRVEDTLLSFIRDMVSGA